MWHIHILSAWFERTRYEWLYFRLHGGWVTTAKEVHSSREPILTLRFFRFSVLSWVCHIHLYELMMPGGHFLPYTYTILVSGHFTCRYCWYKYYFIFFIFLKTWKSITNKSDQIYKTNKYICIVHLCPHTQHESLLETEQPNETTKHNIVILLEINLENCKCFKVTVLVYSQAFIIPCS